MLDGSGFVRRSEVFAGAVSEDTTLVPMLDALQAPSDALAVKDAGVATEKNVVWLRDSGNRYLVVSRERTRRFDPDLAIALKTRSRQSVHVHKVADAAETRLYCYSEARANEERRIAERFAARFEGELKKLSDGLSRPRTRKRLNHVWERIGRIKERSHGRVRTMSSRSRAMATRPAPSPGNAGRSKAPSSPIPASTACAPTSGTGTRRRCGVPTAPSPTWRPCSVRSNPNWACIPSSTRRRRGPKVTP